MHKIRVVFLPLSDLFFNGQLSMFHLWPRPLVFGFESPALLFSVPMRFRVNPSWRFLRRKASLERITLWLMPLDLDLQFPVMKRKPLVSGLTSFYVGFVIIKRLIKCW